MIFTAVFLLPETGLGFYAYQGRDSSLEVHGFLGAGAGQFNYPVNSGLYEVGDDQAWSGDIRLLAEASFGDDLYLSTNILQTSRSKIPFVAAYNSLSPLDVARSSLFTWEQHDSRRSRSALVADNLYLQYRTERLDFSLGRQPVNLAATFYFGPNDFFAPFAPQTFFRNYKPGVDGLRVDYRLAELSQLSFLAVLSYDRDAASANGWSREPDWSGTSLLLRATREMAGFEWALLMGSVDDCTVTGGSLQGEIFKLVNLRTEGHYSAPEKSGGDSHFKLALGLEKLYANNFSWRLEYFQNSGDGRSNLSKSANTTASNHDYAALGLSYELTPLLNGSFMAMAGLNDESAVVSVNFLYSLADESELSLLFSQPSGGCSEQIYGGSEFGCQPRSLLLEYRYYL